MLIPKELSKEQIGLIYANEADLLNMTLLGMTLIQWKKENPGTKLTIRDEASIEHLGVLSNLESINALLIHQGATQRKRLKQLNGMAIIQMKSLVGRKELIKLK